MLTVPLSRPEASALAAVLHRIPQNPPSSHAAWLERLAIASGHTTWRDLIKFIRPIPAKVATTKRVAFARLVPAGDREYLYLQAAWEGEETWESIAARLIQHIRAEHPRRNLSCKIEVRTIEIHINESGKCTIGAGPSDLGAEFFRQIGCSDEEADFIRTFAELVRSI